MYVYSSFLTIQSSSNIFTFPHTRSIYSYVENIKKKEILRI